jgi:signal transduction histidine kinase
MTKEEALASLKSGSPHERLRAARYLSRNPDSSDLAIIRDARSRETDSYVKTTLDAAITRIADPSRPSAAEPHLEDEVSEGIVRRARTQAIEVVTALFLHEVASPFGLVANAASREIVDYPRSSTKRHIDRVQRIFEGLEQLRSATAARNPQPFDLTNLIDRIIAEESHATQTKPTPYGPRPFMVTTDPLLLRFAICNGLRNAIEATAQSKTEKPVVITWGKSDTDYWITIIDEGLGVTGPVDSAFEPGKSSKKGHIGFGLTIARQAMDTLDGFVTLSPAKTGGSRYELKWGR